jgi:hypothetical protein
MYAMQAERRSTAASFDKNETMSHIIKPFVEHCSKKRTFSGMGALLRGWV